MRPAPRRSRGALSQDKPVRVVITLLVLILLTGWAGFELRERQPGMSQALYGFAILFGIMLIAAFFNFI